MVKGFKAEKYWFDPTLPDEILNSCKDLLIKNQHLIPAWTNEVRIIWNPQPDEDEKDAAAYIDTDYAYRCASITICPPFLNEELEDREIRIRHELLHIVSAPLVSYVKDVANIFATDDTIKQLVDRESSEKVESMTEDLVYILMKMEEQFSKKK